jgi:hypothetical protein
MRRIPSIASERGAVLIQAAIASLVLVGFSTFVVDYGVLWVGRHQAQNAADAGATAGAIARAYDDFDDPPDNGGAAAETASQVAGTNLVWGAASAPVVSFPPCPAGVGAPDRCVRVDVYRNGDKGSQPLPRFFAPLLGIASQGVKATATAHVLIPKATNCLRPWAIPDKWIESSAVLPSTFTKYRRDGTELPPPHDVYDRPTAVDPGTGFTFATDNSPGDLGRSVPITLYTALTDSIQPGWLVPLELTGGYAASVAACNGQSIAVGDQVPISVGTVPPEADFEVLLGQDPGASWNVASRTIDNSCAPLCAKVSPRLVAVAVFDVDLFQFRQVQNDWTLCPRRGCASCPGGTPCVSIVNIVGFFISDNVGPSGYLTSYPGMIPTDPPVLTAQSSFLKATTLVR